MPATFQAYYDRVVEPAFGPQRAPLRTLVRLRAALPPPLALPALLAVDAALAAGFAAHVVSRDALLALAVGLCGLVLAARAGARRGGAGRK
eukprot:3606503-Prymnesium_polylepis.1